MDAPQTFAEVSLGPSVTVRAQAAAQGDVIFLPSDAVGTPGDLNSAILSELSLPVELPDKTELAAGYCFRKRPRGLICYVVTIGLLPTERALRTYLAQALRTSELEGAKEIWVPLMGTGAGRLPYPRSLALTLEALRESGWLDRPGRHATISTPTDISPEAADALNAALEEAQEALVDDSTNEKLSKSDVYALAKSPAVDGSLGLAASLSATFPSASRRISSSLLFFALTESQGAAAPTALAVDAAAETFASAVRELAGERYEQAWRGYFKTNERLNALTSKASLPRPTRAVSAILQAAAATARSKGTDVIGVDHLIEALLNRQEMRLLRVLEQLGVRPDQLLKEYADARLGQIHMKFRNDIASDVDRLGYDRYATAIVDFLTHAETPPPLSISIQAPWGGGKSSLMNLVREKLDPKRIREKHKPKIGLPLMGDRLKLGTVLKLLDQSKAFTISPDSERSTLWTVWFNAWKYETSEQIWAGLVDAIISQIAERLPLIEREKFLLKLQLARIDDGIVRKRIYDRVANIWWSKVRDWTLAGAGLLVSLVGIRAASVAIPDPIVKVVGLWAGQGAYVIPIIMSIYLIGTYFANRTMVRKEPATFSLADFIRVPDYNKSVGEIHQIHADLRRVLNVVPEHAPIVIFIDDLDRCSPGKVAGVVEGVSMLLASDTYRCMFVIGMDPQMVAAALEKAHEDVRKQLPRYERTVPLGWRFMDKFIQLPFTIPPAPAAQFNEYIDWLSDTQKSEPSTGEVTSPTASPNEAPAAASKSDAKTNPARSEVATGASRPAPPTHEPSATFAETRDVGAIIRVITKDTVANPREMKRMINLARFYLALRAARRRVDTAWRAPSPTQYARWIAITLRWPDMMRWLQWGADEASWRTDTTGDNLVVRRLRKLEEIAATAIDFEGWKVALKTDLIVPVEPESSWGGDPKLFEVFKDENALLSPDRLSAAAQREFW